MRWLVVGVCACVLFSCSTREPAGESASGSDAPAPAADPLVVYVVHYPLSFVASRLGGDLVDVRLPLPAAVDPAHWSPEGEVVAAYQGADLILLNGAGYASWIGRSALPSSRLVDTAQAFQDLLIPARTVTHRHGAEGEHSHDGWENVVWLDPTLLSRQAQAVAAALIEARPESRQAIDDRLDQLRVDLDALDRDLADVLAQSDGEVFFAGASFAYLARRYGVEGTTLDWDGRTPLDGHAESHLGGGRERKRLFLAVDVDPGTASRLAELGVVAVVFDPWATPPEQGDYLSVMAANVERLRAASDVPTS